MSNELLQAIGRIRRAMPRNADVMAICDAAESSLKSSPPVIVHDTKPKSGRARKATDCPVCQKRNERQRAIMQRVRARGKPQ